MDTQTESGRGRVARVLSSVVGAVALAAAAGAGGWFAAREGATGGGARPSGEKAGAHEADAAPRLSPRTLANLGVEVAPLALAEHVLAREVTAVVALPPAATRPVHAPVAGRVLRVLVREGQKVAAGDAVAEILRDPFPRPELPLTDALLRPLNEDFHRSLAELRSSSEALSIAREELERIRRARVEAAPDAKPMKAEIDLGYDERRALSALENARAEALRHGLTPAEVAGVESGQGLPADFPMAQRVLARNGLWSPSAQAVLDALPPESRGLPYATVVLGELVGTQALAPALVEAVKARPRLAASFLDLAGLVQQGWTAEALLALEEREALAPVVTVRVPAGEDAPADGDVSAVMVRPEGRVEAGAVLAEVADLREAGLELAPAGADLPAVVAALERGETVAAEPLVRDAGPALDGLKVLRVAAAAHEGEGHGTAWICAGNAPIGETRDDAGRVYRSWRLRPGLRYVARIPHERRPGRFVLPAEAIAWRGPEAVLLLEDGANFRAVPVRVEHGDARVAVVANDGAVFPGDRVVVRGAYALSLALLAASGGASADPHAGHNH